MAHDVFICYSSKDKTTADAVCAVLESEGIRCWIAPRDILVGMSYGEAIVDAIHHAKALVLVFSGHANASPQIEREVERAINKRIPVIPLRIEDVAPDKALEYFLSTPHWLDAFTPPLDRHLRNLAGQIRRLINMPEVAAAAPTGLGAGASPFKSVHADGDAVPPVVMPPVPPVPPVTPPTPAAGPAPMPSNLPPSAHADSTAPSAAAAGAATGASAGSVPRATSTKPATTPMAFFNNLDPGAKVGIGAGILVALIGIAWLLSSSPTPTGTYAGGPSTASPSVSGPSGNVAVNTNNQPQTQPGPSAQPAPSTSGSHLPSDGNVVPGQSTSPSTTTVTGGEYDAVSGADVSNVLSEAGYDPQSGTDNQGDPMITAAMQGLKFTIFFYRCDKQASPERCFDLQFHSSFNASDSVTDDKLNAYNRDNRFGQAYRNQDGSIGLDMSATLQGGVSREHLKGVIDWWKVTLTNFSQKLTGG